MYLVVLVFHTAVRRNHFIMQSGWQYLLISSAITGLLALADAVHAESLQVYPEKVLLIGPESTQQLLLISRNDDRHSDLTRRAAYVPKDDRIISSVILSGISLDIF